MRFSANLGFLFADRPFVERIAAAAAADFDGLEFHDDAQRTDPAALERALDAAGLPVVCLNVEMGAGAAAEPERARAAFDEALACARRIACPRIHVTAGEIDDEDGAARARYLSHLRWALARAGETELVIEPISRRANPRYWLHDLDVAIEIVTSIGDPRLKILFDCYHVAAEGLDVEAAFARAAPLIGHTQIASFPDRAEPSADPPLDYSVLLPAMRAAGARWFGCEHRARSTPSLAWRDRLSLALDR